MIKSGLDGPVIELSQNSTIKDTVLKCPNIDIFWQLKKDAVSFKVRVEFDN